MLVGYGGSKKRGTPNADSGVEAARALLTQRLSVTAVARSEARLSPTNGA
jgi:hypothetical protein